MIVKLCSQAGNVADLMAVAQERVLLQIDNTGQRVGVDDGNNAGGAGNDAG